MTEEDRQAASLKFAKCMREHGVEMEDPKERPDHDQVADRARKAT